MYIESTDKDAPSISKEDGETYAKAMLQAAADDTFDYDYKFKQYANINQGVDYDERDKTPFWATVSDEFIGKVVKVAGASIYASMLSS